MKRPFLICACALAAVLPLSAADSSNPPASSALAPVGGAPSPELQKKMSDVLEAYGNGKYDDALAKLADAEKMKVNDPELINLEGAIYVKQEKWDKASDAFNRALAINPKYFPAQFNTGEVLYLQKKYPDARAIFEKLQADQPKNELLKYKVYLTYLMEGNDAEAKARLDKFDFVADTPAFYYAQAAWWYKHNETTQAESYIASSLQIFPPQANNIFAESLIDAGWLKRKAADVPAKK
jgi:tetratricopeptide (TPR) repeat protein